MVTKSDVWITSHGKKCAAVLYLPQTSQKSPVIVMAHGLGGIKEMRLDAFADEFSNQGYACLLFDYRYFGASEGEPRQLLDVDSQIEDWKAAIAYARNCKEVDSQKVILWGSSFSGGHVLRLGAMDKDISAIISQCPFTDGIASAMTLNLTSNLKLGALASWDVLGSMIGKAPLYIKAAGKPSEAALMTTPDSERGFKLIPEGEAGKRFKNEIAARFVFQVIRIAPGKSVPNIICPVLFCVCDNDSVAPSKKTLSYAEQAVRGTIKRYPVGHFDIYLDDAFKTAVSDQILFLRQEVPVK